MLYLLQKNNLGKNRWKKETDQDWKQINIVWIWLWTMKLGYKSTLYKLHLGANDWRELRDISLRNEIPAVTDWTSGDEPVPEPSGGPHPIRGPERGRSDRLMLADTECVCVWTLCVYMGMCVYIMSVCVVCVHLVCGCVCTCSQYCCVRAPRGPMVIRWEQLLIGCWLTT